VAVVGTRGVDIADPANSGEFSKARGARGGSLSCFDASEVDLGATDLDSVLGAEAMILSMADVRAGFGIVLETA